MGATITQAARPQNTIGKFWPDKIDLGAMRAWVHEHGGGFPFNGADMDSNAEQLGVAMALHFDEQAKKPGAPDMAGCDECGGESPEVYPECPFCGYAAAIVVGEGEPALATAPAAAHDEGSASRSPAKGDGAKAKKKKKKGAAAPAPAEVAGEETKMETTHVNGKANGKADLVKVNGSGAAMNPSKATEKTLDKLVEEAKKAQANAADNYVTFGEKLNEIYDSRVWRLRLDDAGKQRFASFDAFVTSEFQITPQTADAIMKQVKNFSREDRKALGRAKMTLIMRLPPAEREAMTKETKAKKLSKRQVADRVKEVRARTGYEGDTPQQKGAAKGGKKVAAKKAAAKAAALPKPKVTAAILDAGKKTIKLYKRPATIRNLDLAQLARASKIGDQPCGIIELANDVQIFVQVKKGPDGNLQLAYEALRAD